MLFLNIAPLCGSGLKFGIIKVIKLIGFILYKKERNKKEKKVPES